jgi:AraC-like DNA-binding protein
MWDAEVAPDHFFFRPLRRMRTDAGAFPFSAQVSGAKVCRFSSRGGAEENSAGFVLCDAEWEDRMSAARVITQMPRPRGRGKACYDDAYDGGRADVLFYRSQALGIVRHFFEIASQIGRLPSIMGREFFRAKVSHHAIPSFEEQAVFVLDVEAALARLNERDGELVAMLGLFHYSMDDVARMLGRSRSYVAQHFADSVDQLAQIFLETGLLKEDRPDRWPLYFRGRKARGDERVPPPKKPPVSVGAEEYRALGSGASGYSFAARSCKA